MNRFYFFLVLLVCSLVAEKMNAQDAENCGYITGLEQLNVQCGQLEVPENHNDPGGKKIQLSYAILPSRNSDSKAYPMIFLSGGPGGASLGRNAIKSWLKDPILDHRPIILFDQRGIGESSALPNMHQEFYDIFAKNADIEEEQILVDEFITAYKKRCQQQNIRLEYYNSFQSARDVGLLMKHLNFEKYNLYGVSYGTRLARVIQEFFPELLHSVILNSPSPIKGDFLVGRMNSYSLALSRALDYCKNNVECQKAYPLLEEDYIKAITMLKKAPLELSIEGKPFFLNAQEGIYFLRRQLYMSDSRQMLPLLVEEYLNGGGPIVKELIRREFLPDYNFAMWLAVERYEAYTPENDEALVNQLYKSLPLFPAKLGLFTTTYHAMEKLHDASLSSAKKNFKTSDVPTLITVNQFDPVTPPKNGHVLMEKLSNGQLYILDEGGHGGGNVACRKQVMMSFMNDPRGKLNTSCLNLYND